MEVNNVILEVATMELDILNLIIDEKKVEELRNNLNNAYTLRKILQDIVAVCKQIGKQTKVSLSEQEKENINIVINDLFDRVEKMEKENSEKAYEIRKKLLRNLKYFTITNNYFKYNNALNDEEPDISIDVFDGEITILINVRNETLRIFEFRGKCERIYSSLFDNDTSEGEYAVFYTNNGRIELSDTKIPYFY